MSTAARRLKQIQTLAKSPGWKVVEEVMKEEIVSLALQTARNPKKTPEEAAYYAGCLQAAENLLNIVNNLELKLQGQATLENWEERNQTDPFDMHPTLGEQLHH